MLDVSEAEEARRERQRARAMSTRLVQVQEAERRHLARELHDEIGQQLTGLHFLLQATRECPGEHPPALDGARELLGDLMGKVRELSLELRPSLLDDLGLLPALINMFKRFTEVTSVDVHFQHDELEGRFDADVETAAYRVVQEALTNVARHADVQEAQVRAHCADGHLDLQVWDTGRGFDPAAVGPEHSGLAGMRERLALLGGRLNVHSQPGRGTQLKMRIPLNGGSHSLDVIGGEA
jgi:signal transduction histidine kinase